MDLEESVEREKLDKLISITKDMVVDKAISSDHTESFSVLFDGGESICVKPFKNEVITYKRHYDLALTLAEAYEIATGEDYTLKKYQ